MVGLLVFLAGFRHLVRQARADYEWVASLVFGVGLLVIAIELVADGLEAGAALDTVVRADPSVVRGLMEASFPLYGAIGLITAALMLGAAGYATLGTGVLHRWTGWFAYFAAIGNLLAAPSILGGTHITGFYTASGYAPFVGQGLMLIWFLVASVSMLVKRELRPKVLRALPNKRIEPTCPRSSSPTASSRAPDRPQLALAKSRAYRLSECRRDGRLLLTSSGAGIQQAAS